jgi:large subunit ribosomal protein L5
MATTATKIKLDTKSFYDDAKKKMIANHPDVNIFALPDIASVTINVGVGKFKENKIKQDIADYLKKLTSREPKKVPAKVSIATFKLRKGDSVGLVSTLRGQRAKDFLLQLVYIALPNTRDFKGVKRNAFDNIYSTYSCGIESSSIFPSIGFDTPVNFGMQINIKFKTPSEKNLEFLELLNFPLKKA